MASLLRTGICPSCGRKALGPHCQAKGCTWAICRWCKSWGTDDGRRWVNCHKEAG